VATSIAAFVGYTARGIDNRAQACYSFSDFQRLYGGLDSNSEVSYAVQQFFQNGGAQCYVVRSPMHYPAATATTTPVPYAQAFFGAPFTAFVAATTTTPPVAPTAGLAFSALSSGVWANGQVLLDVDVQGLDLTTATGDPLAFNLTVTNLADGTKEYFSSISLNSAQQNFAGSVVNDPDNGSQLVSVNTTNLPSSPTALTVTGIQGQALSYTLSSGVNYLESVNTVLAGSTTGTTASAACGLTLTLPTSVYSAGTTPTITIIGNGGLIPQTVAGLASQLQQALNTWLSINVQGASVVASAAPNGTGTQGIRVNFLLPNDPDAIVSFGAPGSGNDIAAALGIGSTAVPTSANVAHYALGTTTSDPSLSYGSWSATTPSGLPQSQDLIGDPLAFSGIYALQKVPIFNLLSIPEAARAQAGNPNALDTGINPVEIYSAAITLCDQQRALLLIDPPPNVTTVSGAVDWKSNTIGVVDPNGAAFWPRLRLADARNKGNLRTFAPSGVVAGVYAKSDGQNGVWTAPAGISATLNGVQNMTYQLSDLENGALNPLGLNCFRTFPIYGPVLWGSRTLVGADAEPSQWKYVPVRRMALFLESSLYRGTQWVVFQPNDERLWAAIRLNVSSFLQTYFLKGAFQGTTPDAAYFVKCDNETTTQTDIHNGVVNILVGFAPLMPAEFVVIQIEQLTGQAGS
jgi:hypothetical protein